MKLRELCGYQKFREEYSKVLDGAVDIVVAVVVVVVFVVVVGLRR